jgi:choline kinase
MRARNATSITPLSLDDCPESSLQQAQAERSNEEALDAEIKFLMHQTRMWRVINSAQWVAWGIVQAKTPGMVEEQEEGVKTPTVEGEAAEEEEEFDYLAYSQDRALFFWSDLLAMNLVKEDDLPPAMVEHIKARAVDY